MPATKKRSKKSVNKKFVAELHITYSFVYNPESEDFKKAFESYRKNINPDGDEQDMMAYVAHNTYLNGRPDMVEGVGIVSFHGYVTPKDKGLYSGIDVPTGLPLPDIDIISNDYI